MAFSWYCTFGLWNVLLSGSPEAPLGSELLDSCQLKDAGSGFVPLGWKPTEEEPKHAKTRLGQERIVNDKEVLKMS